MEGEKKGEEERGGRVFLLLVLIILQFNHWVQGNRLSRKLENVK